MTDDLIRKTFAGCLVIEKIGQGGMGVVYKAHHIKLNKVVCIKILPRELEADPRNIDFFLREAEIAKQLDHPNTVHVYDYGKEKDRYYIIMSYVEGKSLEKIVEEKGYLSLEEASDIILGVLKGLEHAHSKNIIHRDIKPSNIIITKEGIPRIIDFGLARRVVEEKQLTIAGEMIGTAYFMSPEQGLGEKVDARADLYAVGATYFYILTGKYPFEGKSAIEVINQHINSPLPNLYLLKPDIPIWTVRMIEKLMRKKPQERYQTATEVIKELEYYKENGYKNIVQTQEREIILEGIEQTQQTEEKKPQQINQADKSIQEDPFTPQNLEKITKEEKQKPINTKIKLQSEKAFVISSTITHIFLVFLTLSLIVAYGYFYSLNRYISYTFLLGSIFSLFKIIKKTKLSPTVYILSYSLFFLGIDNLAKASLTHLSFFEYLSKFIETFRPSSLTFSIFLIITIHSLYNDIKDSFIKRIVFSSILLSATFLTSSTLADLLQLTLLEKHRVIIILSAVIFSTIVAFYKKNLYLISYLLLIFLSINLLKIPYINKKADNLYTKELNDYQIEVEKIKRQVREEIYLLASEGAIPWHEINKRINKEITHKIASLEQPQKSKIIERVKKDFNSTLLKEVFTLTKNTSFLTAVLILITLNLLYVVRVVKTTKNDEV